jgi:hypothetical protein
VGLVCLSERGAIDANAQQAAPFTCSGSTSQKSDSFSLTDVLSFF